MKINPSSLGAPVAEGGEGCVYISEDQAFKVYKPHIDFKAKKQKLEALMNLKLPDNAVAPTDLLYDANQKFIGYAMPFADGEQLKKLSNKTFVKTNRINVKQLLKLLIEIKNTLKTLHEKNVYVGDLNDCNILFNQNCEPKFIDTDSWSAGGYSCEVCMDSFKDPLLAGSRFNAATDAFAFAVLTFKILTRLHPFGGTSDPDMDLVQRMDKRISVLSDTVNIKIPKNIAHWRFLSPRLKEDFIAIFEKKKRFLIDGSLESLYGNLQYCETHGDYYFSKFTACPVCDADAKIQTAPEKAPGDDPSAPILRLFSGKDVLALLGSELYMDNNGHVVHIKSGRTFVRRKGTKVFFSNDGAIVFESFDKGISIHVEGGNPAVIPKKFKSDVSVHDNRLYYVGESNELFELAVTAKGNIVKSIAAVSTNAQFQTDASGAYFIYNRYDNMKVYNVNGFNHVAAGTLLASERNAAMHRDPVSGRWMFIIENDNGTFHTKIFDKNQILSETSSLKFGSNIQNLCFYNNTVFKANAGFIRGYHFESNKYKDFPCGVVEEDAKLIRNGTKFTAVNEKEIFLIG